MLTKLAFKNAGKSIKDYLLYFFTLAFGVCIFYMFNSIHEQQAMMDLTAGQSDSVKSITGILNYVSAFVAVVLGFLIVYANNFFIKRRKKELGIYITLGMEKRSISVILVLQTSLVALMALVAGLFLGVFLSQFMSIFTAKIFEADMTAFSFVFSMNAVLKSIMYFGCIFLIVILFNTVSLKKYKLIDLIYGERKNENLRVKNGKSSAKLFAVSLCVLATAYYLILKNGMVDINAVFFASIMLGIIGTLLFFYSLSGLLTALMQRNKRTYFNGMNMFVVRQLGSKINTNFVSISVVCIILLLTIGIFSTGYSMQSSLSSELKGYAGFDYSFFDFNKDGYSTEPEFAKLIDFLKENENVKCYGNYRIHSMENNYGDFGLDIPDKAAYLSRNKLCCISLTDYNAMLKLQGKETIALADNEYGMLTNYHVMTDFAERIISSKAELTVNHKRLTPAYSMMGSIRNGSEEIMVILPDAYVEAMPYYDIVLNMYCTHSDVVPAFDKQLKTFMDKNGREAQGFNHYTSRDEMHSKAITIKATVAFITIYIGIVFMMTCAAILAIQQLTEAADNKYRYDLLKKLGTDRKMLNKALFSQILCYFVFPLALAMVHAAFGLTAANHALKRYGNMNIGSAIVATATFIVSVYAVYFLMTYAGSKSVINKN